MKAASKVSQSKNNGDQSRPVDAQAFGSLYSRHYERLLNSMTTVVRDRDHAEDITATAFTAAYANLSRFRGDSSFYTWLYTIALNESRKSYRCALTVSLDSLSEFETAVTDGDHVADALNTSAQNARLRTALRQIPLIYRQVLDDHFLRAYPVKVIARRRNIPLGTVLSRIFTGKRMLREAWGSGG